MNHTTATPVILTVSLMVLLSGSIGAAAQDRGVRDTLGTAANTAIVGLARGQVVRRVDFTRVRDDLSPLHGISPAGRPMETPLPTPTFTPVVDDLSPIRGGR
jgi:hypothetical protein